MQYLNNILLQIKKQIYLELLDQNDLENNQTYIIQLGLEMQPLMNSKEEHFELCNLLNHSKL